MTMGTASDAWPFAWRTELFTDLTLKTPFLLLEAMVDAGNLALLLTLVS